MNFRTQNSKTPLSNCVYVVLGLVASIFAVGYLVLLRFGMNFWQLFLILIPAEAVVYFSFHIRAKH